MLRIARLPVPLRERRVCVAMSGMGTAAFGVCVQPTSADRLDALESAAYKAVWRSPGRANRTLALMLFSNPRADPAIVMSMPPVLAMRGALRAGTLTSGRLAEEVAAGHRVGPVAAFATAVRRLGAVLDHNPDFLAVGGDRLAWVDMPAGQLRTLLIEAQYSNRARAVSAVRADCLHLAGGHRPAGLEKG